MKISIEYIETLLLIAAVVAMAGKRLKIPYTVGLILAGVALVFLSFIPDINPMNFSGIHCSCTLVSLLLSNRE